MATCRYATNVRYAIRECVELWRATKSLQGLGHVASRTGGVPYSISGVESVMYHPFATSHRSLYSGHTESLRSLDSTKTCQQNGAMDGGICVGCCERCDGWRGHRRRTRKARGVYGVSCDICHRKVGSPCGAQITKRA